MTQAERALFIVSTYGEGDPPDNASLFAGKLMPAKFDLPNLHFGVLMLGDSQYAYFCGFGRTLTAWLQKRGAQALFDSVAVDNADVRALHDWQHHLSHIAGTSDAADWQAPSYQQWRLAARHHLNPGSAGAPTFHLELEALDDAATWEAGDLVQVLAPGDQQRPREYSNSIRRSRASAGPSGTPRRWHARHRIRLAHRASCTR